MRVSFDFDDTITQTIFDLNDPHVFKKVGLNQGTLEAMRDHVKKGDEIYIVTSRKYSDESLQEIEEDLRRAGVSQHVRDIIHVGDYKATTLQRLGIELHYDDDIEEIKRIPDSIATIKVKTLHGFA